MSDAAMSDAKTHFSTVELDTWSGQGDLLPEERRLIERTLLRNRSTLEGGTAGGRILLQMSRLGFTDLAGFDFVPELIERAKRHDTTGRIHFTVQDATRLDYSDAQFDQIVYLQGLINCIDDEAGRLQALREASRILKPGGIILFSGSSFDDRQRSWKFRPYLAYLRALRTLRRSSRPIQALPLLKVAYRFNPGCLIDRGPYIYWYRAAEMEQVLREVGFEVADIGSARHVMEDTMQPSSATLLPRSLSGFLYVVCRKPLRPAGDTGAAAV